MRFLVFMVSVSSCLLFVWCVCPCYQSLTGFTAASEGPIDLVLGWKRFYFHGFA